MINHKFALENAFQDILYRIDTWIKEGSVWNADLIESQYINISTYWPLSGGSYIQLPTELKSPKKDKSISKIMIKSVFFGVILGILILQEYIHKEFHKMMKSLLMIIIIMGLNFLCKKKILAKLKKRTVFASMSIATKTSWLFQSTFQIKILKTQWICCL